ncbi:MAG: RtcB family protein, partial [Planctomycetota bacterium]
MRTRDLMKLGIPKGPITSLAIVAGQAAAKAGTHKRELLPAIRRVVEDPSSFLVDPIYGEFAVAIAEHLENTKRFEGRSEPAPYRQWGEDIEEASVRQMQNACQLPIAVRGALMPDAHLGYGLPIGGVLATENAVIPYAVGVDIACRVKMTVFDTPVSALEEDRHRWSKALERETRFGLGAHFEHRRDHSVLEEDWSVSPVTQHVKDKAWKQLGTSGGG